MPRLSVIMPFLNAAPTLRAAAASMFAQTFTDFELIAIDNGSTDGGAAVLTAMGDPRLRLLTEPRRGIVPALNTGLAAAQGEWFARLDADDWSYPERLARQLAFLDAHPGLMFCATQVEFGGDGAAQAGYARYVTWQNTIVTEAQVRLSCFIESPFAHPSWMFHRTLIAAHGPYRDGAFPEDYEMVLRWHAAGVRMAKVPEVLVRWNDPPTRLSRTDPRYHPDTFFALKAAHLAAWLARHNPHHPDVVVWGARPRTRHRAEHVNRHGIRIVGWLDTDPHLVGNAPNGIRVGDWSQAPGPDRAFILTYITNAVARQEIHAELNRRGFVEGETFLHCA